MDRDAQAIGTVGIALAVVLGLLVAQTVLPMGLDFLSTIAVGGIGFYLGRRGKT